MPLLYKLKREKNSVKIKTIKIFRSGTGLETLDRKTFIENLDMGVYDGQKIEVVETER